MFDSKKKEMLENLKNDKEYIDELKILNELLKYDKCIVPSKEFNIFKRHKRLEFLAYMYGYNLSVKSLKEDYTQMRDMLYNNIPDFEDIIAQLIDIEKEYNFLYK